MAAYNKCRWKICAQTGEAASANTPSEDRDGKSGTGYLAVAIIEGRFHPVAFRKNALRPRLDIELKTTQEQSPPWRYFACTEKYTGDCSYQACGSRYYRAFTGRPC